jgi:hypothetical protein
MLFLLVAFGAAMTPAENANTKVKMEARVYFSNPADVIPQMGSLFSDLDIVQISKTPQGEHYLLIDTDHDQLRAIQLRGFKTEVTFATLRDKLLKVDHWDPESFSGRNFGYFFTYYEMRDSILHLAQNYPNLVRIDSSMLSFHQHPMYLLKISDTPDQVESKPQFFCNGAIHAREPMGCHACVVFATMLLRNYGVDSLTTWLVHNRDIYIMPVQNVDGYIYNSDSGGSNSNWRKNRNNTSPRSGPGVDCNRNYGYKWGYDNNGSSPTPSSDVYRGPSPFSEPETQQVRDFQAAHKIRTELDFHTYGQDNLYPYGYADVVPRDSLTFQQIIDTFAHNNGYTINGTIYRVLYTTNGTSIEWEGGDTLQGSKFYTYAITSEIGSTDFWYGASDGPYVDSEVNKNIPNLYYMSRMAGVWLDTIAGGRIINDTATGNGNGQLDPGETANIWFKIMNRCLHPLDTAESVTAVLHSSDTVVQVLTPSANFPTINPRRGQGNNGASQFQLYCNPNATPSTTVNLRLEVTYLDDTVPIMQPLYYRLTIGNAPIVANDVGCTRIVAPVGVIDSGTVVAPACSVYNYGSSPESYSVRMSIGAGYNETASVTDHQPGTRVYVTFPDWTASPAGLIAVTCSTQLSGDQTPANDRRTTTDTVTIPMVRDVGCTRIIAPVDTIDSGFVVAPACSVYNYGGVPENYSVRMKIGTGYNETASVTGHEPGTLVYVTFPSWPASPLGMLAVTCSTQLSGDVQPANDAKRDSVQVLPLNSVSQAGLGLPTSFALHAARPNPVSEQTVIRYDLAAPVQTRIEVYDVRGELVRELMAERQSPGRYEVAWNRRDAREQLVAPGVYFCRMQAGDFRSTLKLLLVK